MKDFEKFKLKASQDDFQKFRNNLRENYSEMENFCAKEYGKGDFIDWLSKKINLFEENENIIQKLVSLDTIRDSNLSFDVNQSVEQASFFLRNKFSDVKIETNFNKDESYAVIRLLKQVRDNLTHYNKSEIENMQYQRNYEIIKICSDLSDSMIGKIKEINLEK